MTVRVTDHDGLTFDKDFMLNVSNVAGAMQNGASSADALLGTGEKDILNGLGGNDTLDGGAGADQIDGGVGDDIVMFDEADTVLTGGDGHDTLIHSGMSDLTYGLAGRIEADSKTGRARRKGVSSLPRRRQHAKGNQANKRRCGRKAQGEIDPDFLHQWRPAGRRHGI